MGTLTLRASFPNPQGIILPGLYVTLQAESTRQKILGGDSPGRGAAGSVGLLCVAGHAG